MAEPAVVIILDELDKIFSPDRAQDFINEIKALFNLDSPGFLFLISVSEDALASFERRGLPVRDAFDSAFDAIVRIEHLTLEDARAVLNGRILGMPEPFIALCHCMSGGLPRELIRIARQVTAQHGTLADVSRQVVGEDLRGKVAGLRTIIARSDYDETLASELVRHVEAHSIPDPAKLVEAAGSLPMPPSSGGQTTPLQRLQLETLGYLYYLGTVLEVFGPRFTEDDLTRGRDSQGDASFDTLSSVPQLFAVNARLAWSTISAFRTAWTLPTIQPPELAHTSDEADGQHKPVHSRAGERRL